MSARIKVVPDAEPNNEGRWIEVPIDLSIYRRWRHMEVVVKQYVPAKHHVVAVERGSK